jgi:hypothetical protein
MNSDSFNASVSIRSVLAFRLVQWATLAALAWKIGAFVAMARCYVSTPLRQDFFPVMLQSVTVLVIAYLGACVSLAIAAMTNQRRYRTAATWSTLACVSVLCIHQGSHNDMTFATAWWTSLWSVWLAGRIGSTDNVDDETLIARAALLSRLIVSMILLGGAVGKWTSEYWSGHALYEIYFIDRDFWFFNLLRSSLDAESLRVAATWYSRKVIVIESVCGLGLWLLPARWAATVAMVVLASIALLSNFHLFSVLLSLLGLAASGFFVAKRPSSIATDGEAESVGSAPV